MGAASNAKGQDNDWLSQYLRSVRREVGTDTGKSVKDYARGAVVGLLGGLPDAIYSGMYPTAEPLGATEALNKRWNATGSKSETIGGLLGLPNPVSALAKAGLLSGAIKVWHGSPHKFDKFDFSKIGTGEGAQAYGHGGYFAEAKDVAKEYKDLKPITDPTNTAFITARSAFAAGKGDAKKALQWIDKQWKITEDAKGFLTDKGAREFADLTKAREMIRSGEMEPGNLYEANLRWPDAAREAADPLGPQHFLDWDKPLAQQNERVKSFVAKELAPQIESAKQNVDGWGNLSQPFDPMQEWKGSDLLQMIRTARNNILSGTDAATSAKLNAAGIPGIRYLDGGSRNAGQGTSNYVAFDDALAEILSRNGQPLGLLGR